MKIEKEKCKSKYYCQNFHIISQLVTMVYLLSAWAFIVEVLGSNPSLNFFLLFAFFLQSIKNGNKKEKSSQYCQLFHYISRSVISTEIHSIPSDLGS